MSGDETSPVRGQIDREGRLVSAGPALERLQSAAGGTLGGPVAIPPIASIARLARTLSIPVSRRIAIGSATGPLGVFVRAAPDGDGVRLTLADWERGAPDIARERDPERERVFAELEEDGAWQSGPGFLIDRFDGFGLPATPISLTRWLRFHADEDGEIPALEAFALRSAFSGQVAAPRHEPATRLILRGEPRFDAEGAFAGYRGGYRLFSPAPMGEAAAPQPDAEGFSERLHTALRQPIARIVRNADAIAARSDGPIDDDYAGYASDIALASRHLLGLADDLRDLQTIESEGFSTEAAAIDVGDVARRAAGLLGVRAADKGVRLDAPPADEEAIAIGDFRRVLQIVANLVGNAVRHSPQGASVWLRIEEEDDVIALVVADQGAGIAAEDHDRIFDKFERLSPADANGSGLGLYISRRLARAMGGDLTVDSAPGQGARFILTLPKEPSAA